MLSPRVTAARREVDFDRQIDSKTRLVGLIINQKRLGDAAKSVQRIFRSRSDAERLGHGMPAFGRRGSSMDGGATERAVDVA